MVSVGCRLRVPSFTTHCLHTHTRTTHIHATAENSDSQVARAQEALKGMDVKRVSAGEMGLNEY